MTSYAKALYPFTRSTNEELSLETGDIVQVNGAEDSQGWLPVIKNGVSGVVPASYVQECDAPPPAPPKVERHNSAAVLQAAIRGRLTRSEPLKSAAAPPKKARVPARTSASRGSRPHRGWIGPSDSDAVVLQYGIGGLAELVANLREDDTVFAVLQVVIGSGTLARIKMVFINWTGPDSKAIARAKHNSRKGTVENAVGLVAVSISAESYEEVAAEAILERLRAVVAEDHGDYDVAFDTLTVDIFKVDVPAMLPTRLPSAGHIQRTGSFQQILDETRKAKTLNWALFTGKPGHLTAVDCGGHGLLEMLGVIEDTGDDQIYFGIVSLFIGSGAGRKLKHCFLTWLGPSVGTVTKGRALSHSLEIEKNNEFGHTHFKIEGKDDLASVGPEVFLDRLKSLVADDNFDYELNLERVATQAAEEVAVVEGGAGEPLPSLGAMSGTPTRKPRDNAVYTRGLTSVLHEVQNQNGLNWVILK